MSKATHVHCPRCAGIEPAIFTHITVKRFVSGKAGLATRTFTGLEILCRTCGYEVTKIGTLGREELEVAS